MFLCFTQPGDEHFLKFSNLALTTMPQSKRESETEIFPLSDDCSVNQMKLLTCISILCITLLTYDWLIESLHECAHVPNNEWWTVSVCDGDYIQLITESGFLFSEIIQWWMESAIFEAKSNFHFLTEDHGNVRYRLRRRRRTNHILFWKTMVRRTYSLHLYLFNDIYTTLHIIIYYLYGGRGL